ncbi:MAG: hypothetical protein IKA07_03810 [Alistipes sp.]|nr:hypothetical protein [Alistipes sp.]
MNIKKLTSEQWQELISRYNAYQLERIALIKTSQLKQVSPQVWDEWEIAVSQRMDTLRQNQTKPEIVDALKEIGKHINGIGSKSIEETANQLCDIFRIDANRTLNQELPFSGVGFITLDTNDILEFVKYKVESLRAMSNLELYKFLSQNKEQIKEMMR